MDFNDDACILTKRGALRFFASRLAPTENRFQPTNIRGQSQAGVRPHRLSWSQQKTPQLSHTGFRVLLLSA